MNIAKLCITYIIKNNSKSEEHLNKDKLDINSSSKNDNVLGTKVRL